MAVKDKPSSGPCPLQIDCTGIAVAATDSMEWNAEEEVELFNAMSGLKPIGINKHFFMACICARLSAALKRDIGADVVWAHLHTMYNLKMLDSMQPLPFPQDERDFALPNDADFKALMAAKKLLQKERSVAGGSSTNRASSSVAVAAESGDAAAGAKMPAAITSHAVVVVEPLQMAAAGRTSLADRSATASPVVKCE